MLEQVSINQDQPIPVEPSTLRQGNVSAMLRMMGPLNGGKLADPVIRQRRLLADLCRFLGASVGAMPPPQPAATSRANGEALDHNGELPPRLEQTLHHLLAGASEKQVASHMKLSRHTVHVYVKALYRRYGVSSRAELLAKHFKR